MIQSHEPAILDLTLISLHGAIRRVAARLLEGSGELEVTAIRRVGSLMRIALDLAGVGSGLPLVKFHGIPPAAGSGLLPEILAIPLTDRRPSAPSSGRPSGSCRPRTSSAWCRAGRIDVLEGPTDHRGPSR
jgi:hypothetical protein